MLEFAEGDGTESCPLCGEGESSDSREEVEMGWSFIAQSVLLTSARDLKSVESELSLKAKAGSTSLLAERGYLYRVV